ncbi:MAG: hypothetical protein JEZ14_25760 [Marinilabiliaceae bacterium]|nr:hypothetical protein [Marinilabiliaceae bacterium]
MKLIERAALVIVTILISSCSGQQNHKAVLDRFNQKKRIAIEKESSLNTVLNPKSIRLMNDVLLIKSVGTDDYLMSVIDTSDFKELARFGSQGKGPNEIGVMGFINKLSNDLVLVSDLSDFNNYLFSIQNILSGDLAPSRVFKVKNKKEGVNSCLDFIYLNSGKNIVGTGIHGEGRYALYDEDGVLVNYYIEYPQLENIKSDNELLQAITFQAALTQPKENRYFASLSRGVIDILEYSPELGINLVTRKKYYKDKLKYCGNTMYAGVEYPLVATTSKSIIGFEGDHFESNSKYIYSLFSDKKYEDFKERHSKPQYMDLVTFDWNGDPHTHYQLDREVIGFAVSDDNKTVFFLAYNEEGEPVVLKSRINS